MRKLILIICFLLIPVCCFSGAGIMGVLANSDAASPGGDGSVGQTDFSGFQSIGAGSNVVFGEFTASPGVINYGHMYIGQYLGDNVTLTLYNSSGTVLAYASVAPISNTAQWYDLSLTWSGPQAPLEATTYYCALNSDGIGAIYHNGSGTGNTDYEVQTYSATPSDISPPGTDYFADDVSIIFNNTAGSP